MKKILLSAMLAVFACGAHAASLNWSMNQIQKVDGTGLATGYSAYLFVTEQSKNFGAQTTTIADITNLIKQGDDISDYVAGTKTSNNGMVTGATGYNGTAFGGGDSLTAFAVIFDAADYAHATHFIVTETQSQSWANANGVKNLNFGSMNNKTWTPVPEPSTAALALAGLALLLKRRRA